MNLFQDNLQDWFSRTVPERGFNQSIDFSFILSSDIGLVRTENQDRVSALYTGATSVNPLFAIAAVDGMGGMRDGRACAILTISSFYYALVHFRYLAIYDRASAAIAHANSEVFKLFGGHGGATLSAVLIDGTRKPLIVHLGDTRIYSFGAESKVKRHTVDDSLAEAVGGSGRELLQFVGMGESMQATIAPMSTENSFCAITTDGIHYIEEKTLDGILTNASNTKQASERLSALARWCGGHDNASSAIFDINAIFAKHPYAHRNGIRIWDAYGDLTTLALQDGENLTHEVFSNKPKIFSTAKNQSLPLIERQKPSSTTSSVKKRKGSEKKERQKKPNETHSENIQLNIEIGNLGIAGGEDNGSNSQ